MKKVSTELVSRLLGAPIIAAGMLAAMSLASSTAYGQISTGSLSPDGLVAAPIGATLYAAADTGFPVYHSHILAISTQLGTITADTPLTDFATALPSRGALQLAISKDGTLLFVLNNITKTIDIIAQATNTQIATLSQPQIGPNPIGIRISPNGKEIWVANAGTPPAFNNGSVQVISAVFPYPSLFLVNTAGSPNEVVFNSTGTLAYVLNGLTTGWVDIVNAKTFKILSNQVAFPNLNSPNPLSMDITKTNSSLYIGNGDTNVNDVDIPSGAIDTTIFMFPGFPLADQTIGQTLISPSGKSVVTADPDIAAVSVAKTKTDTFTGFAFVTPGAVPYFMTFAKTGLLYVSDFNNTVFATQGGLKQIDVIAGIP